MEDFFEENTDSTPKSDIIFKILFGNPKHPRLLIHLLNAIIRDEKPITEVDIKQTELTPEFLKGKGIRLDVLAKTSDGQLINIEIQKENEHNMVPRSQFYWSKIFAGQAVVNEKYEDLKRTICINIMNFRLFEDGRYWRKDFLTDAETKEKLTDLLEIHFLELPKIRKLPTDSPLMFWLEFINDPESEKIKDMYKLERVYEEAREAYKEAIADPAVQELIRIRNKAEMDYKDALSRAESKGLAKGEKLGLKKGEKIGLEKGEKLGLRKGEKIGLEKGEKNAKIESAKKALFMGLSVDQISAITGLLVEEIESLR